MASKLFTYPIITFSSPAPSLQIANPARKYVYIKFILYHKATPIIKNIEMLVIANTSETRLLY